MSDENKKYVPEGVFLVCDKGTIPTQLICDPQEINIYSVRYADENDNKPQANITSFGVCKVAGTCEPPPGLKWIKLKEDVTLHGFHPLLEDSECICPKGGIIKIFFDKYAAELAAENNSESDFVKEPISSMALGLLGSGLLGMIFPDYRDGVGRGLKKGAEGTWNLLKDIWNKPGETLGGMARGLGNMAVLAAVYGANGSTPGGTIQSDMMLRSLDARFGTDFVGTRDALATGVGGAVENAVENVRRGNWGEVGEDVGQIQYAVIEAILGSKGAGLALRGVRTGAQAALMTSRGLIGAQRLAQIAAQSAQVLNRIKFATSGIVRIGRRDWMHSSLFKFGSDGATLRNAARLKPKEGWYDVLLHGHKDGKRFLVDGRVINADQLAQNMISQGYKPGTPIRLISCDSGKNATGGAARLSKILNTTVEAPTTAIAVDDAGEFVFKAGGKMATFEP